MSELKDLMDKLTIEDIDGIELYTQRFVHILEYRVLKGIHPLALLKLWDDFCKEHVCYSPHYKGQFLNLVIKEWKKSPRTPISIKCSRFVNDNDQDL